MKTRSRRPLFLLLVLALASAISCGDEGTSPPPPTIFGARLASPADGDGAALLRLTGPVEQVTTATADTLLLHTRADTTWVFVALRTPGELTFTVRTPELAGRPSATVLQVVGPDNALRDDLDAYTLELEP